MKFTNNYKMKVYIAGKVTGLERAKCSKKFERAKLTLEALGYVAVNPLDIVKEDAEWNDAMRTCIKSLMGCDAIYLLDNWHDSEGAKIEYDLAKKLQMKII